MICAGCGGSVEWKGPLSALTHTECEACGAIDNQEPETAAEEELESPETPEEPAGMKAGDTVWVARAWDTNPLVFEAIIVSLTTCTVLVRQLDRTWTTRVHSKAKHSRVFPTKEGAVDFVVKRHTRLVAAAKKTLSGREFLLKKFVERECKSADKSALEAAGVADLSELPVILNRISKINRSGRQ